MRTRDDYNARPDIVPVLSELMGLRVLTCLMAHSLAVRTAWVEALPQSLDTDMQAAWSIDDTFFDVMRDKETLNGIVAEVAGISAAKEHITATARTQNAIIKAWLDGTGISQIENWTPRYMAVPMQGYPERSALRPRLNMYRPVTADIGRPRCWCRSIKTNNDIMLITSIVPEDVVGKDAAPR